MAEIPRSPYKVDVERWPILAAEASELGWPVGHFEKEFEYEGRRWVHVGALMHGLVVIGWEYRAMFGSPSDGELGRPYLHVLND